MLKGIIAKMVSNSSIILLFCSVCALAFALHSIQANAAFDDTVYIHAENNVIASSICKAINMGITLMIPLFAIMFCIIGLQIFQGQIKWTVFLTFFVGIAAFKGAGTILEFFMPNMGLEFGCKCATYRYLRDTDGTIKMFDTGLDEKCRDRSLPQDIMTKVPTGTASVNPATPTTPETVELTIP